MSELALGRVGLIRQFDYTTGAWLDPETGDLYIVKRCARREGETFVGFEPVVDEHGSFDVLDGNVVCWYRRGEERRVRVGNVDLPVTAELRSSHGPTLAPRVRWWLRPFSALLFWYPFELALELRLGERVVARAVYTRPRLREKLLDAWLALLDPTQWPTEEADYDIALFVHKCLSDHTRHPDTG